MTFKVFKNKQNANICSGVFFWSRSRRSFVGVNIVKHTASKSHKVTVSCAELACLQIAVFQISTCWSHM